MEPLSFSFFSEIICRTLRSSFTCLKLSRSTPFNCFVPFGNYSAGLPPTVLTEWLGGCTRMLKGGGPDYLLFRFPRIPAVPMSFSCQVFPGPRRSGPSSFRKAHALTRGPEMQSFFPNRLTARKWTMTRRLKPLPFQWIFLPFARILRKRNKDGRGPNHRVK